MTQLESESTAGGACKAGGQAVCQPATPDSAPARPGNCSASPAPTLVAGAAVGLTNLGNTCFFNSALQLLLACPQLNAACKPRPAFSEGGPAPPALGKGPLGFALQQALLNVNGEDVWI